MKYRVLVTGIGTIIGYGIIQSLKKCRYDVDIYGMDMDPDAVGKVWCDHFILAVPACSGDFIGFLKNTIKDNQIDLVFLGTEQELRKISVSEEEMGEFYSKIVINSGKIISVSEDKWLTYLFLAANNIMAIESYISGSFEELSAKLGGTFLIKPRHSYSSRGVVVVDNKEDFDYYRNKMGNEFLAQRYIGDEDHEFTVSAFAFGDGTCMEPIILRRKLSFEGSTIKAAVEFSPEINDKVEELVSLLKPVGPTNFQYREEDGVFYLLETNPRISSATSLRTAFGYNEAEMCICYFLEKKKPQDVKIKKGKAMRYISDYVEFL